MKRNLFRLFFMSALTLLFASAVFASGQKRVSVRVDGLSCPFCAYGLEKKLKGIDGVEKLDIKINDGLAILTYKETAKIDTTLIIKKVKEAGFTPGKIVIESAGDKAEKKGEQVAMTVDGMTCDTCVARVKKALEEVDCVRDVEVDLEKGLAALTCTDKTYDKSKLVEIVNDLGFKAELRKE